VDAYKPDHERYSSSLEYQKLVVNESLLKSLLANITISALSLNTWYGHVSGTETRPFNIYRFENKVNFFLAYGLSLLLAMPFIGIGLLAIRDNGVTAIDGGFLQILMTTTGRTKLEAAAVKGCVGCEENIPLELINLKIRLGELVVNKEALEEEKIADLEGDTTTKSTSDTSNEDIPLEQSESSIREAINAVPNSEICSSSRINHRIRTDRVGDYAKLTSSAETYSSESYMVRRVAFGTVDETKPLKKGGEYSW
jgi:hypothetical protein